MAGYEVGGVLSYPHKSDSYTYRVPTPPRIIVPPPQLNAQAVPEFSVQAQRNPSYAFLGRVDYRDLIQENAPLEWSYERRREAQTILPFLSLGPMMSAKDDAWLQREGVTMLLGVRQKDSFSSRVMSSVLRVAQARGLEHHTLDLATNQDLIQSLPAAIALINAHLERNFEATEGAQLGKVLVFCESGNERSAGVVAAYLMETLEEMDYIKAMQLVQAQRFCVNFDDSMKRLLQGYWDILCAQRAVAGQAAIGAADDGGGGAAACSRGPVRAKRGLDRGGHQDSMATSDTMEDDDDNDDVERFGGRTYAPFKDVTL